MRADCSEDPQFLLQLATTVNSVPLPPVPEVYGIRLPPPAQRLTAPNFSIVPRAAGPPEAETEATAEGEALGQIDPSLGSGLDPATREGSEADGNLFGDDDDEDDEDEDEDDADMEDVTAGLPPTSNGGSSSGGTKRKAEEDEEYD